jgi:carotenoid cleavage dioxygenase-like enzyme
LPVAPRAERLRITAKGIERHRLADTVLEFPRVAGRSLCRKHGRIYGVSQGDEDFLGVPAAIDPDGGTASMAPMAAGQFAGELVPVTKPGASSDDDVWLLTLVLDADARRTELWVLEGADLAAPPVAVVTLPHVVPFGFHGNWARAAGS